MYKLLIAEDEQIERMALRKTLEEHLRGRCVIFEAENGREALRIYEQEHIQIAILDIEMPGINGIEAALKIREKDKVCGIIFLTAYDEFEYARKAVSARALEYLLKPCDDMELLLTIEEAMSLAGGRIQPGEREGAGIFIPADARQPKVAEMIRRYIDANYMRDFSMQDLAQTMNYSDAYFCKLFKQYFNKSFIAYLTEYRVERAAALLRQTTVNIKDIGKAVGYIDSNYFAKVFRRITGYSPSEYRAYVFRSNVQN
ncbi:MAG: response regulator [Clostridiales bacterium]|jgi:YesN/AraC family two-component response regulator|nr:response regulator [Clostridiales bacterium]